MNENIELIDPDQQLARYFQGISYVTSIGESFSQCNLNWNDRKLSIREAFSDYEELEEILKVAKVFKKQHPQTFNGVLLGNPIFKEDDSGVLNITAEQLHYFIYFAAHTLRQNNPAIGERYAALSTAGSVFNRKDSCFYLSVRPADSQEDPGMLDAPGGTLDPSSKEQADPIETAKNRFKKKLGFDKLEPSILGVERIFDDKYSLYNIVTLAEVDGETPTVDPGMFRAIPIQEIEDHFMGQSMSAAARASLLLALGQDQFLEHGWGKDRVSRIINLIPDSVEEYGS